MKLVVERFHQNIGFAIEDWVRIKKINPLGKFKKFELKTSKGRFKVIGKHGNGVYNFEDEEGERLQLPVNGRRLILAPRRLN